jgi:phosphoserine phosphatase RsbU/P
LDTLNRRVKLIIQTKTGIQNKGTQLKRKEKIIPFEPNSSTFELPLHEELAIKDRALAAAAEGITISDARLPDNPLIYLNAGFERLTGYSARSMIGKNCRFLQGSGTDDRARKKIRNALKQKRACTVEILNYRKNGTPFWNRLSITPVRDASGQVSHFIGIQTDITARKRAEEELTKANNTLEVANQRMKKDFDMAASIQQSLLPPVEFSVPGVTLSWTQKPCDELAGDTLNVFKLDKNHLGLYVIDVSGHGVSAALLSFTLTRWMSPDPGHSSLFTSEIGRPKQFQLAPPAQVAERLNRQFPMDLETGQYFTFFYGILNLTTRLLRYVNAGHPRPIHLSAESQPSLLPSSGYPVGLVEGAEYEEANLLMKRGDRLVVYTDGITEACNRGGEEFGLTRLLHLISSTRSEPLKDSVQTVTDSVMDWCEPDRQNDDISLLALQYNHDPLESETPESNTPRSTPSPHS